MLLFFVLFIYKIPTYKSILHKNRELAYDYLRLALPAKDFVLQVLTASDNCLRQEWACQTCSFGRRLPHMKMQTNKQTEFKQVVVWYRIIRWETLFLERDVIS